MRIPNSHQHGLPRGRGGVCALIIHRNLAGKGIENQPMYHRRQDVRPHKVHKSATHPHINETHNLQAKKKQVKV